MKRRTLLPLLWLALLLAASACKQAPVSEAERELFLRARDLEPYGIKFPQPERYERFGKTIYFDGSRELEYEFELPDDAAHENAIYMSVTVTFEKSAADARFSQGAEKFGAGAGMKIAGLRMEERPGFFSYGDESSFYVLLKGGEAVGNFFVTREGAKVYTALVAGVSFDDRETWAEFVTPRLHKFSAHKP